VPLHDPGTGLSRRRHPEPDGAIVSVYLDHQCAEEIEPETATTLLKAGILRHRRRNVIIDPVIAPLIVVVGPPPAPTA
jgi:hypothetical protein